MWKLTRKKTISDEDRMKSLETRLDAAVAESKRMRHEMDELQRRDELRSLRKRSKLIGADDPSSDETIN